MTRPASSGGVLLPGAVHRKIIPFLVKASVSVAILAALFWWLPVEALLEAIGRIPIQVWLFVMAGFLAGHFVSALKWRLLLGAAGVDLPVRDAVQAHASGLFANLCLPSVVGGDVVRAGVAIKGHGKAEAVALGSLTDRVNDTLALVMIAGVAGVMAPNIANTVTARVLAVFALVLPLVILVMVLIIRYLPSQRLPERFGNIVERLRSAMNSMLAMPAVALAALMLSLLIQGGFVLLNIVLASAMHIDAPASIWFLGWPLAKLVALAPVSLGGIGVREAALAGLLAPFGIAPALVVAQSLSWEVVLVVSGLLSGLAVVIFFRRTAAVMNEQEEVSP